MKREQVRPSGEVINDERISERTVFNCRVSVIPIHFLTNAKRAALTGVFFFEFCQASTGGSTSRRTYHASRHTSLTLLMGVEGVGRRTQHVTTASAAVVVSRRVASFDHRPPRQLE